MSTHINQFLDEHGVKVEMNTNYMLDAFTLNKSENHKNVVLVMDTINARNVKHVNYTDYISLSDN